MIGAISTGKLFESDPQNLTLTKLKRVCAEFESILLSYMFKSMNASLGESGVFKKRHESKIFQSMMDEYLAMDIAKKGGIGIGNYLYGNLRGK